MVRDAIKLFFFKINNAVTPQYLFHSSLCATFVITILILTPFFLILNIYCLLVLLGQVKITL